MIGSAPIVRLAVALAVGFAWAPQPLSCQEAPSRIPAFPGAEGFGAYTVGGRGGDVYLVTTLADYGDDVEPIAGSLRAAVEAEGPRTVVFRVSGYIDLVEPLEIENPNITIAGQTAPGDGVTLRRYGIEVAAPQTIIRHLRVRPGDIAGVEQDAVNILAPDVIVDHCSVSWGTDETLSVIGAADRVTVQWCIISESLHESVHSKGPHGYGSLLTATGDVTIHHSAYVLHYSRNPRPKSLTLDFRNNVVYGFGGQAGYNYDDFTRMNYVGNYLHPLEHSRHPTCAFSLGGLNSRFYVAGNRFANVEGAPTGDWDAVCFDDVDPAAADSLVRLDAPVPAAFVTTHDASEARDLVLERAGAIRPARDQIDQRVLATMRAGTGAIVNSQEEVGGWPLVQSAEAPADLDRDGLPDNWEEQHGFDPEDPTDQSADADQDGYTNLEEYLNNTDPHEAFAWVEPPTFRPPSGAVFTDSLTVIIVAPEDAESVRYTLDGSDPGVDSPTYAGPIRVDGSTHVRALAVRSGAETMPSFGYYERLEWQEAAEVTQRLRPGLRFGTFVADDWDEVDDFESLEPVRSGTSAGLDFSLRDPRPVSALAFDGMLEIPSDGVYAFYLSDDYRSEVRIDGRLAARGKDEDAAPGYAALRAGLHTFHVRILREAPGPPTALEWESDAFERQSIPDSLFHHLEPIP